MDIIREAQLGNYEASASQYEKARASSAVGKKMDSIASTVGEKLEAAASLIRGKALSEGTLENAATELADGLEEAGFYLRNHGVSGAIKDTEILIRRYPVQSLLVGVCVGFFLARMRVR